MSWLYSLCILGDKFIYREILNFLQERNYHVRRQALSILTEIIDEYNYTEIGNSIIVMMENEQVPTVRGKGEDLLNSVDLKLKCGKK